MKNATLFVSILAFMSLSLTSKCNDTVSKDDSTEELDDYVVTDSLSPYWYDENQTEPAFSADGDTLYRYPHNINVSEYVVPSSVRCIFERAFQGCRNLKQVVIPRSVESVEMATFYSCRDLERVYLYARLDTMPYRFLNDCNRLKELHIANEEPPVVENYEDDEAYNFGIVFGNSDLDSLTLYVPEGAEEKYKQAYGWRMFRKIQSHNINIY